MLGLRAPIVLEALSDARQATQLNPRTGESSAAPLTRVENGCQCQPPDEEDYVLILGKQPSCGTAISLS